MQTANWAFSDPIIARNRHRGRGKTGFPHFRRSPTALSISGKKRSMFSAVSTISITSGRSVESRKILEVYTRWWAPYPSSPRSTVAPAIPCRLGLSNNPLVKRNTFEFVALKDLDAEQLAFVREHTVFNSA
jgi:hypothetical protein